MATATQYPSLILRSMEDYRFLVIEIDCITNSAIAFPPLRQLLSNVVDQDQLQTWSSSLSVIWHRSYIGLDCEVERTRFLYSTEQLVTEP
uniref:Mediator of RNA polymerase II transcription subunit 13 n=1 Tax=Haemonchus contortus TaxID=6289 RepID=A0A7I4Z0H7_HAECO